VQKAEQFLGRGNAGGVHAGRGGADESLSQLLAGDAGGRFVDALVQTQQWDKLASLWVRGCAIDWQRLHAGAARRRVSFPSAPFENVSCDIRLSCAASPPPALQAPAPADVPAVTDDGSAATPTADAPAIAHGWFRPGDQPSELDPALDTDPQHADDTSAGGDERARQYWLDHLRDIADTTFLLAPALLPARGESDTDRAEPGLHAVSTLLKGPAAEALQRCTQLHRVEVQTLIVAAWSVLVNRYTKARCAQFGILRAFAPTAGAEPVCNLVPVRICTVQRERIAHWLPALQRNLDRKRLYAHTPIEQIEGWIGVENLFDSVIVFDRPDCAGPLEAERSLASQTYASQTRVAMELHVTVHPDAVALDVVYKAARDERDTMQTVLEHFKVLLEGLAKNPERNPAALAMRTRSEGRDRFWKSLDGVEEGR
jgi:polyketide synthase PksN